MKIKRVGFSELINKDSKGQCSSFQAMRAWRNCFKIFKSCVHSTVVHTHNEKAFQKHKINKNIIIKLKLKSNSQWMELEHQGNPPFSLVEPEKENKTIF